MSLREFDAWTAFYRRFPFDDRHRYHRPAALVSVATRTGDVNQAIQSALDYLEPEPLPEGMTLADYNTMRAFGVDPNTAG
jgi:hypothetical protein